MSEGIDFEIRQWIEASNALTTTLGESVKKITFGDAAAMRAEGKNLLNPKREICERRMGAINAMMGVVLESIMALAKDCDLVPRLPYNPDILDAVFLDSDRDRVEADPAGEVEALESGLAEFGKLAADVHRKRACELCFVEGRLKDLGKFDVRTQVNASAFILDASVDILGDEWWSGFYLDDPYVTLWRRLSQEDMTDEAINNEAERIDQQEEEEG